MLRSIRKSALRLAWLLPLFVLAACGGVIDDNGISVGADAPDFTLPNAAGGDFTLADYSGQPVLLYFHMAGG